MKGANRKITAPWPWHSVFRAFVGIVLCVGIALTAVVVTTSVHGERNHAIIQVTSGLPHPRAEFLKCAFSSPSLPDFAV